MLNTSKNTGFRLYPWVFIPLLGLIYYTTFFMMSMTTDFSYGFDWMVVLIISVQFGVIWGLTQWLIKKLIGKGWKMDIKMFILGVVAVVLFNDVLFFTIRTIYVKANYPHLSLFNGMLLALTTIEGFLKGIIVVSLQFSLNFFQRWRTENEENERLKRNELELQNRALISQLNPHFLFNNLNTLAGLIQQDKEIAGEYLKEMSDMYRYILKATEKEVTSLKEEIQFAENYLRLIQKRLGKNLSYTIQVSNYNYVLPPISLHLLLENVIKHNRIDNEHHMQVSIKQVEGELLVENTIHLKNNVDSTGKGLQILTEQYKYLTNKTIETRNKEGLFLVQLPLLKLA